MCDLFGSPGGALTELVWIELTIYFSTVKRPVSST